MHNTVVIFSSNDNFTLKQVFINAYMWVFLALKLAKVNILSAACAANSLAVRADGHRGTIFLVPFLNPSMIEKLKEFLNILNCTSW